MPGFGSLYGGFMGQGPGMVGIRSTAQGGAFGGLTSLIPGYDANRPIQQPTGMVGIAPQPRPMMPTMGTAIRGMFGGGGASITPRPSPIGSAIGGMAPMRTPHVLGKWGLAHPEIVAQRQADRRARRGLL